MEDNQQKYRDFFLESPAGQHLIEQIDLMIRSEQDKAGAETDMQASFTHSQRAEGMRSVIGKINSLTAGVKKPVM